MSFAKSVVISCAGIGSRLGLATTKALIKIEGKTLIAWQLEQLANVEDIRIVVGFQAKDVIDEVLKYRKDAIFVYNHDYFNTKTGASFYLGARHANEYVIELDGDLLIHPKDMQKLLQEEGEYIAYADKLGEDAVFVRLNEKNEVIEFSREGGDYEWTGPACLSKEKIFFSDEHVYNIIESHLPMRGIKVRACDVDTYEDYKRAIEIIQEWNKSN